MEVSEDEKNAIRSALKDLGGEQSIDAVRSWIRLHHPKYDNDRRIGTILRGYSNNMPLARERHPLFGTPFAKQTKRGFYTLA